LVTIARARNWLVTIIELPWLVGRREAGRGSATARTPTNPQVKRATLREMPRSRHQSGARKGSVKSRQRSDLTYPPRPIPRLTPEAAGQMVRLLHAGLPAEEAVRYVRPESQAADKIAAAWLRDPLMLDATALFIRGPWEDLDPDQRLILARDKYAYECICDYLKTSEGVDDPVAKFLAEMRIAVEKADQDPDGAELGVPLLPPPAKPAAN
jgi:hypothetical protein